MPHRFVSKLPEVTPAFWAAKILAGPVAALGAAALAGRAGLTVSTAALAFALVGALAAQFAGRRYVPARYWLVVLLAAGTGRLLGTYLTEDLGVPGLAAAAALAVLLAGTLVAWRRRERTLSINTIDTPSREAWYWLTALVTFTLGSLAADLVRLGYPASAALAAVPLALVAAGRYRFGLDPAVAFWLAFLLTEPFGLLLGDLLARTRPDGGAGLGPAGTGLTGLAVLVLAAVAGPGRAGPPRVERDGHRRGDLAGSAAPQERASSVEDGRPAGTPGPAEVRTDRSPRPGVR